MLLVGFRINRKIQVGLARPLVLLSEFQLASTRSLQAFRAPITHYSRSRLGVVQENPNNNKQLTQVMMICWGKSVLQMPGMCQAFARWWMKKTDEVSTLLEFTV